MNWHMNKAYLLHLDSLTRRLLIAFVFVLSLGYFSGVCMVSYTTGGTIKGVQENYLGNEDNEEAVEMKFKKSAHEMLTIIHTHIISLSIVFLITGILVNGCSIPSWLKGILIIEPFISIFVTFGGIYLMWSGAEWMSVIVYISGLLMNICFTLSILVVLYTLIFRFSNHSKKPSLNIPE